MSELRETTAYVDDGPLVAPQEDRLGRAHFARRVAETIAGRREPTSFVVGIYGEWGDGKTTVLNFILHRLKDFSDVVTVCFNPWMYPDEQQVLVAFFRALMEALDKQLTSGKENLGEWIKKYAHAFDAFGGVVGLDNAAQSLGRMLSPLELEDLKKRVESTLDKEKKRVVVVMDDIDRLDKNEIFGVFRLVKLAANFRHTAYLLAFDEKVIGKALAERYPGSPETGASFLEKIVQVPLKLPRVAPEVVRSMVLEEIQALLTSSGTKLTNQDVERFRKRFDGIIHERLTTLRAAKRYLNASRFYVPLLEGEANVLDVLLLEVMRALLPELYESVRRSKQVLVGGPWGRNDLTEMRLAMSIVLNPAMEGLQGRERDAAEQLLMALFPRTKAFFGSTIEDRDEAWTRDKRVAAEQYFDRFFSFGIPVGDLPDRDVTSLLNALSSDTLTETSSDLKKLIERSSPDVAIWKLSRFSRDLAPLAAERLVVPLVQLGGSFPDQDSMFGAFDEAARLATRLLQKITDLQARSRVAESVVMQADPVGFAVECLRWIRTASTDEAQEKLLPMDRVNALAKRLVERIVSASQPVPLYLSDPKYAARLYSMWRHYGDVDALRQHVSSTVGNEPEKGLALLRCYTERLLDRESYDALSQVIEPQFLLDLLQRKYSDWVLSATTPSFLDEITDPRRVAWLAIVHRQVTESKGATSH